MSIAHIDDHCSASRTRVTLLLGSGNCRHELILDNLLQASINVGDDGVTRLGCGGGCRTHHVPRRVDGQLGHAGRSAHLLVVGLFQP